MEYFKIHASISMKNVYTEFQGLFAKKSQRQLGLACSGVAQIVVAAGLKGQFI